MKTARICFLWHMHQPYYTDPVAGSASMPWVRLHATAEPFGRAREPVEIGVADDGVDDSRVGDDLGRDQLGARSVFGLGRQQKSQIARKSLVMNAVVMVYPGREPWSERVDEVEGRVFEGVFRPAALRRERDVEDGHSPDEVARPR